MRGQVVDNDVDRTAARLCRDDRLEKRMAVRNDVAGEGLLNLLRFGNGDRLRRDINGWRLQEIPCPAIGSQ
jgi:hypothetical protein